MIKMDLHCHSNNSNGKYKVAELLKIAEDNEEKYFAITDHDNIDSILELKKFNIKELYRGHLISGLEFKITYKKVPMEILVYNYNYEKLKSLKYLKKDFKNECQTNYLEHLKKVCKEFGIIYSKNLCLNDSGFAANTLYFDMIKYKENMKILEELNISNLSNFYRDFCCNSQSKFYIDESNTYLNLTEAVNIMHECGALVFLAHPFGEYKAPNLLELINEIAKLRLVDGLECFHRGMNEQDSKYLLDLCHKNKLFISGGSDFHNEENHRFGYCNFKKNIITADLSLDWLKKCEDLNR